MSQKSKKGFAFLLFGIMLSPLAYGGVLQWLAIVGWFLGLIGLLLVLTDSEDSKNDDSGDDNKDQNNR